jgi:hypothetical protein
MAALVRVEPQQHSLPAKALTSGANPPTLVRGDRNAIPTKAARENNLIISVS